MSAARGITGSSMLGRVFIRHCLPTASRLQPVNPQPQPHNPYHTHHLYHNHHQQYHPWMPQYAYPATIRLHQATCQLLPWSGMHSGSSYMWQQHDATTEAAPSDVAPPPPSTIPTTSQEDAAIGVDDAEAALFEEQLEGKTYITPTTTDTLVFNGIPFNELPVVHIKATYNNTHLSVSDYTGKTVARTSCGTEGFKNAKKGTAIAAQTAGIAAATKALEKGMSTVRIMVKGIGPGRQTAIKGLQMGGLEIVSITDNTPVPHNGCRPRKARRL